MDRSQPPNRRLRRPASTVRRVAIATALLAPTICAAPEPAHAQDGDAAPELVRRFDGPVARQSSWPVLLWQGERSVYVMQTQYREYPIPVALWRLHSGSPDATYLVDLAGIGSSPQVRSIGDSALLTDGATLYRLEDGEGLRSVVAVSAYPHTTGFVGTAAGRAFLSAGGTGDDGPSAGSELWVSDGTAEGTRLLRDIEPGPDSSYPNSGRAVGNELWFAALTSEHGPRAVAHRRHDRGHSDRVRPRPRLDRLEPPHGRRVQRRGSSSSA